MMTFTAILEMKASYTLARINILPVQLFFISFCYNFQDSLATGILVFLNIELEKFVVRQIKKPMSK